MALRACRLWVLMGWTPACSAAARYFALVPKTVIFSCSAMSQSRAGEGWNGEPSNRTTVAPTARLLIIQFHIIQPQVVK